MDTGDEETDFTRENALENGFNVVDVQDLNKAELDAMKGDIIGDTVYSSKWIIKTLISLSKVYEDGWSTKLENELCTLWDMTAEKDVVIFLKDNDFLQMAEFTIKISEEPRLTEIIVGIVGNMCCQPTVLEAVGNADNLVSIIFGLLSTDDTETLIQILRLLQNCVWDIQKNQETKWLKHLKECDFLGDAISFILQNSTNENLLITAIDLLQSISSIEMPDQSCLLVELFKVEQLISALVESFVQLIPKHDVTHSRSDLKFIESWLTIFSNIIQSSLDIFAGDSSNESVEKIMKVLDKILEPYVHFGNLFPFEERLALCIHDCVEMISWFQRNKNWTNGKIISVIVTIMHELRLALKEDPGMERIIDTDEIEELVKYLERYWLATLHSYEENELLEIIRTCRKEITECLIEVTMEYSKECPDAVAKLSRVESLRLNI